MADIRALPTATTAQIRSSFVIPSLAACVLELAQNSLDAGATRIEVAVGPDSWYCKVTDNGQGIDEDDLRRIAKRYHTSKARARRQSEQRTYGYRGEALASIAQASLLEIASRHASSSSTLSTIIHGGEPMYFGPAMADRPASGTTVTVRDLFYRWPVRQKQASLSPSHRQTVLSEIRKSIEQLAIINCRTSFTIHDAERGVDTPLLHIPATIASLLSFGLIHGQELVTKVHVVENVRGSCRITGFISLASSHTKTSQLIAVNGRALSVSDLHRQINKLFSRSSFSRFSELAAQDQYAESGRSAPGRSSPRRQAEHYPAFYLHIELPDEIIDVGLEPSKRTVLFTDEAAVCAQLETVIQDFLYAHGFSSKAVSQPNATEQEKPAIARPGSSVRPLLTQRRPSEFPLSRQWTQVSHQSRIISKPSKAPCPDLPPVDDTCPCSESHTEGLASRPAPVENRSSKTTHHTIAAADFNVPCRRDIRDLHVIQQAQLGSERPAWLRKALAGWVNPTFPSAGSILPRIASIGTPEALKAPAPLPNSHSLSKDALKNVVFLEQVDHKFLLCRVPIAPGRSYLVLFDQHAVDERVRVEQLLKEYCAQVAAGCPDLQLLPEPQPFLLDAQTVELLRDHAPDFHRWGLHLEIGVADNKGGQCYVTAVPVIVSSRLRADVNLVKRLVKQHCSKLAAEGGGARLGESWTNVIRQAPAVLVDLINSRACRGAVMFNDDLDRERCESLLDSLKGTDYPFICAHGRPSIVPLTTLPDRPLRPSRKIDWKALKA